MTDTPSEKPSARANITLIQQTLAAKGFSPGNIDGRWGPRTAAAVKAFQLAKGLVADGIVGPLTSKALLGQTEPADPFNDPALVWLQEARHLLGIQEYTGPGSNRVILDWASKAGIPYKSDDVAWCGLFVAHCISATLSGESLPANPLGAQNWLKFGGPCSVRPGAVLVFWREHAKSWKGHVGFYAGEDHEAYHVLGGNQSNKVCIARIERNRLLGVRWPATVALSHGGPVTRPPSDVLSSDEF